MDQLRQYRIQDKKDVILFSKYEELLEIFIEKKDFNYIRNILEEMRDQFRGALRESNLIKDFATCVGHIKENENDDTLEESDIKEINKLLKKVRQVI